MAKKTVAYAAAMIALLGYTGCAMADAPRDVQNAMLSPFPPLTMGGLGAPSGGCLNVSVFDPETRTTERYSLPFGPNVDAVGTARDLILHPPFSTFSFNRGPTVQDLHLSCSEPTNKTITNITSP